MNNNQEEFENKTSAPIAKLLHDSLRESNFTLARELVNEALLMSPKDLAEDISLLSHITSYYKKHYENYRDEDVLKEGRIFFSKLLVKGHNRPAVSIQLGFFYECSLRDPEGADEWMQKAIVESRMDIDIVSGVSWFYDIYLKKELGIDISNRIECLFNLINESEEILIFSRNAITSLKERLANNPNFFVWLPWLHSIQRILDLKGDEFHRLNQKERADEYYQTALDYNEIFLKKKPQESTNYYDRARIYEKMGVDKYKEYAKKAIKLAEPTIDKLDRHHPHAYKIFSSLGDAYRLRGRAEINLDKALEDYSNAIQYFLRVVHKEKGTCFTRSRLTECYRVLGEYEKAVEQCNKVIEFYLNHTSSHGTYGLYIGYIDLGDIYSDQGNFKEARNAYLKAKKMNSIDLPAYDKLTILYQKFGRFDDAINELMEMMKLEKVRNSKSNLDFQYYRLAQLYYTINDLERAIHTFKLIIERRVPTFPYNLLAVDRLSLLYMKLRRWNDANELFQLRNEIAQSKLDEMIQEQQHDIESTSIQGLEELIEDYIRQGNHIKANEYNKILLQLAPMDKVYLTNKARTLMLQGQDGVAEHVLINVNRLAGPEREDPVALFHLGKIYMNRGDLDKALEYFKASYYFGKDVAALDKIALVYRRKGDFDAALNFYTDILAENSSDIRAMFGLSETYLQRNEEGDIKKAVEWYIKILDFNSSDLIAARKLIDYIHYDEGFEKIKLILSQGNPRVCLNIVQRLTESNIFNEEIIPLLKDLFASGNLYLKLQIAKYFMRHTIYHYFYNETRAGFEQYLRKLLAFFRNSSHDNAEFVKVLAEYFASEKGAYMEFFISKVRSKIDDITNMVNDLSDLNQYTPEELQELMDRIKTLLDEDAIKEVEANYSGQEIHPLKDIVDVIEARIDLLETEYIDMKFSLEIDDEISSREQIWASICKAIDGIFTQIIEDYLYQISKLSMNNEVSVSLLKADSNLDLLITYRFSKWEDLEEEIEAIRKNLEGFLYSKLTHPHIKTHWVLDDGTYSINLKIEGHECEHAAGGYLNEFLIYMWETYIDFDSLHKDVEYWDRAKALFSKSVSDIVEKDGIEHLVNYAFRQLDMLFTLCKSEAPLYLGVPFHKIKNRIGIIEQLGGESDINKRIDEIKEICSKIGQYFRGFRFPNIDVFSLKGILLDICNKYNNAYGSDLISFKLECGLGEDFKIEADRLQISDCFDNLAKNAVEAITEKREKLGEGIRDEEVCLYLTDWDDFYKIVCQDTGIGADAQKVEEIFHIKKSPKEIGSGLGLKIVKRTIEKIHDGSIKTSSNGISHGMSFEIILPKKSIAGSN